jgi:arginyl-tRNA synthetase
MNTANISQCPEVTLKCFLLSRFPSAIAQHGTLGEIPLNRSKDSARVLYVSAIALKLAKTWQQTPQTIAATVAKTLEPLCYPDFAVKVAPAGIIELELTDPGLAVWLQRLAQTNLPLPESRILSPVVSADRLFPIQYSHARCCSLLRMAHRDRIISIVQPDVATAPQIWSLAAPNPIPWMDDRDRLRLVHPAERSLISQLLTVLDNLYPIFEVKNREKPVNYFKLANSLSEAFQIFYSQCRIWGEVKIEQPKLAQARVGLILATQSLLRFILENFLNAIAPLEL